MKLIFSILLLLSINAFATEPTALPDIVISTDTTVNNTWNIATNRILRIIGGGRIHGTGTINGGIIEAAAQQHIFDTTLTINTNCVYSGSFSAKWFCMSKDSTALVNGSSLQKAVNTCMSRPYRLYIP